MTCLPKSIAALENSDANAPKMPESVTVGTTGEQHESCGHCRHSWTALITYKVLEVRHALDLATRRQATQHK